jgi:hypothetical protein
MLWDLSETCSSPTKPMDRTQLTSQLIACDCAHAGDGFGAGNHSIPDSQLIIAISSR